MCCLEADLHIALDANGILNSASLVSFSNGGPRKQRRALRLLLRAGNAARIGPCYPHIFSVYSKLQGNIMGIGLKPTLDNPPSSINILVNGGKATSDCLLIHSNW